MTSQLCTNRASSNLVCVFVVPKLKLVFTREGRSAQSYRLWFYDSSKKLGKASELTSCQELVVAEGVVALLAEGRLVDCVLDEAGLEHLGHVLPGIASILPNNNKTLIWRIAQP